MDIRLDQQVAWITGATGALGRAIALRLGHCGATVVLSSRNRQALEALAQEIAEEIGAAPDVLPLDVTDDARVQDAVAQIVSRHHRLDVLVNSTTLPIFGEFMTLRDEDWDRVIQTKLMGYLRCIRAVTPTMTRLGGGRIVNISGRGGRRPPPVHLPGSAVNAALNVLGKGLAQVLGPQNIRINTVAPGPIASPRWERISQVTHEVRAPAREPAVTAPLRRLGEPEDVADAVLYLVSDLSRFVTGEIITVDGGDLGTL